MAEPLRVVVFLDYQNCYHLAREAFFPERGFHVKGQVNPRLLGELVASRQTGPEPRLLSQVRVYTRRPSSTKHPKAFSAHMRQCAKWEKIQKVEVILRTFHYPADGQSARADEQALAEDELAGDFVTMRTRGEYDIGVLFSNDPHLLPALESVCEIAQRDSAPLPEVAAWGKPGAGQPPLRARNCDVHCHWLNKKEFDRVADSTDYNKMVR